MPKTQESSNQDEPSSSMKKKFSFRRWFQNLINTKFSRNKLEDTVVEIIEDRHPEGKKLSAGEQNILHNFLHFGDKTASDAMIPRSDICAVKQDDDKDEIIKIFAKHSHTRMPVFKDNIDDIRGFIHIKDMINVCADKKHFTMQKLLRKILVIPHSKKLIDVLTEMKDQKTHIGIVVDEYGGTDGMVTIEDVIEEIVGEIQDEHDVEDDKGNYEIIDKSNIICNARMELADLEKLLKISFESDDKDYDTIGGLILDKKGSLPAVGDVIELKSKVKAKITQASPRSIKQVKILLGS